MNTLLVTGATGVIGNEVTRQLSAAGVEFAALVQTPVTQRPYPVRHASFDEPRSLEQAFEGIDTLFVLLPLLPGKLRRARNVAYAARAAGVRHIVRSGGLVQGLDAGYALPALQRDVDDVFLQTGIACTLLHNATYMQNYLTFKADMVKAGTVYGATGDAPESLVDARDIAAVAAAVLAHPAAHAGRTYTLTGAEALTDSERMAVLAEVLHRPVRFQAIPPEVAAGKMLDDWKMPAELVGWIDSLNKLVSAGMAAAVSPDVQRLLGRAPLSFRQFALDHAARWQ